MKVYLYKIYAWCILLSANKPTFWEKMCYFGKLVLAFGPIVAILEAFKLWAISNQVFIGIMLLALVMNCVIGMWYHDKMNTFKWSDFIKGNIRMFSGVVAMYILLEILRSAAGDNVVSEVFKSFVQLSTLLWPVSKSLKNLYIIFDKKFPPSFIMDRLYNFEKTGNVRDLYDKDNQINNAG